MLVGVEEPPLSRMMKAPCHAESSAFMTGGQHKLMEIIRCYPLGIASGYCLRIASRILLFDHACLPTSRRY